jgi:xylulokinase
MSKGMPRYIIGIDAGTSSVKGLLLDDKGETIYIASNEYSLESGPGHTCELDAEIYWEKTILVIRELLEKSGADPYAVEGVSISCQGETMIIVDEDGKPLRKAFVWLDNRSAEEAIELSKAFDRHEVMEITGLPEIPPILPATKILWLRKHQPDIFRKASKYLMVEDFLLYRFTGRFCTEYSIASDSLYFDISKKIWWDKMVSYLGITENQLPLPLPSGAVVGHILQDAAEATGLTIRTKCITGSYDHPAGAIGAGSILPGSITLTIGSSMAMCIPLKEMVKDPDLKLNCQCHSVNGLYFLLPYSSTAGMVLRWFRDEFCGEEIRKAETLECDPYILMSEMASSVSPGADGLVTLPHLAGSGSPDFNPLTRGVFCGIALGMKKGHFIRSIMEAVACDVERNIEFLCSHNLSFHEIRLLGGASRSRLWPQIIADVTGMPVVTMKQHETAALGAAILAGTATGIFPDLPGAIRICQATDKRFDPDPENQRKYRPVIEKYTRLSETLKNYW